MVTSHDRKHARRVGKRSFFDVLDPGSIDAYRNVVFRLASDRAGVTTNTFSVVNDESVIGQSFTSNAISVPASFIQAVVVKNMLIAAKFILEAANSSNKVIVNFDSCHVLTRELLNIFFGGTWSKVIRYQLECIDAIASLVSFQSQQTNCCGSRGPNLLGRNHVTGIC